MRVLFLLSSLEPAGSETYCVSLAKAWSGRHEVFWVSDRLHFGQAYRPMPISQKLFPVGLINIAQLSRWVLANRIEVMHAHSRRANTVAAGVSAVTGVPYVVSVHLRHPRHAFQRMLPCWGSFAMPVCRTIEENLLQAHGVAPTRVRRIHNGIDVDAFRPAPPEDSQRPVVTFLGRLSGRRWDAVFCLLEALQTVLPRHRALGFRFVGPMAEDKRRAFTEAVADLNGRFGHGRVEHEPFAQDVRPVIADSLAVVASGRSLLEAMSMGTPVVALGERETIGLLGPQNFDAAMASNFGDFPREDSPMRSDTLVDGLSALIERGAPERERLGAWCRLMVCQHYNLADTAHRVDAVYTSAILRS